MDGRGVRKESGGFPHGFQIAELTGDVFIFAIIMIRQDFQIVQHPLIPFENDGLITLIRHRPPRLKETHNRAGIEFFTIHQEKGIRVVITHDQRDVSRRPGMKTQRGGNGQFVTNGLDEFFQKFLAQQVSFPNIKKCNS